MVFAIKFDSPDEAAEEEYALRDGWGSEINTAVSGDTVYVEGGDLAKKVVNDWYPDNEAELVDPPEDIAKMLHWANEANTAKSYVLAHKGPNDTTYCKNKAGDWTTHIEDAWEGSGPDSFSAEMKRNFADTVHCDVEDLEVVPVEKFESFDFDTPHFKPREYEGEYILYTLYGLDSDGDELERIITSPKKSSVTHAIKEHPEYRRIYNGMHIVAILYNKNDRMLDSEVVWSTNRDESKGSNEKLSYEKGHKNSKGEDAPWVIRDHKNGKVLASFSKKDDAEAHLERMKHYSKDEKLFNKQAVENMFWNDYKAAIKAAWSAAEVKWFRLDFQESSERLDVYPIASDNEGVGVDWGVLPDHSTIVQYTTDLRTGNSEIEREMPYKDLDELEKIFVDEFMSMDETLEIGVANGADIHPLTEGYTATKGGKSFPVRVTYNENPDDWRGNTVPDSYTISIGDNSIDIDAVEPEKDCVRKGLRILGYDLYEPSSSLKRSNAMGIRLIKKNEGVSANEGVHTVSYFTLVGETDERDVEKFVSILEDAVLDGQSIETTTVPNGAIDVDIYGQLSPDEVSRILQVASQLGIHVFALAVNI
jgi:hypothetical protein